MPQIVTGGEIPAIGGETTPTTEERQEQQFAGLHPQQQSQIQTPQIINNQVPVVVFVGPASSGKSMILVRLAKYLRDNGYTVETDPTFLNTDQYAQDCEEFNNKLGTTSALGGTVEFLLVSVKDKTGTVVAKLLEAPGEDFYSVSWPEKNKVVKPYLSTIMTSRNRKTYVVLLDLDSEVSFRRDQYHRDSYQQRFLKDFYPNINKNRDRIVLLYNKIDVTSFGNINGCDNPKGARDDAKTYYKQLFSSMKVSSWGGLFSSDNFVFKTFCTGMFSTQFDNFGSEYKTYNMADDVYPKELWKEITRKF